ncbi:MAG: transglycosylase SLT domain-containing protein [Vibrio gallaecicus]
MFSRILKSKLTALTAAIVSSISMVPDGLASVVSELEMQRINYEKAQDILDKKDLKAYQAIRPSITAYPLTPYVDYRAFLVGLDKKSPAEVRAFIAENKAFPFSNRISAPYLSALSKNKDWEGVLEYQIQEPVGEKYQCIYYRAHYEREQHEIAFNGAKQLWLSGNGVDDQCDPLFNYWDKAGLRTDELILERMLLAFENRNGKLMSYLTKQLDSEESIAQAKAMKAIYRKPEGVLTFAKKYPANDFYRSQTEFAFEKLARKSSTEAQSVFNDVMKAQKFPEKKQQELADYVSFRLINTDSDALAVWRDDVISTTSRQTLLERRARLAIQHADWSGLVKWVSKLDESHQASLRWQYWLGRAEVETGKVTQGKQRLMAITGQRNFYSVAAAKEIKQSINYSTSTLKLEREKVAPFKETLVRISELIDVDKIAAAKSEWRWLLSNVTKEEKAMLAAYAAQKGWNHLSVTASISAKIWDNITLRFPVAHKWWFNFYAEKHDLDPITLMSLARQESALDADANSPVGARGIMQIMPATAKYTAKKYKLAYQGRDELYEVGKNIEIGSHYLDGLLNQYDNNRIFALAAYNAGPNRVKLWRKRTDGKLDAYAFIEAIPFKETRGYVQNILMFETYYRDILGVDGAFLNEHEVHQNY